MCSNFFFNTTVPEVNYLNDNEQSERRESDYLKVAIEPAEGAPKYKLFFC